MPFYEYDCAGCGTFTLRRSMEDRNLPAACPECEQEADRLMGAPSLGLMSSGLRRAHAINEKSRHEPRVSAGHHCSTGCGCGSPRKTRNKSTRTVDLGQAG